MKKLHLFLTVLFLFFWSCEEEQDTTPPTVNITFVPQINSTVSEMVSITCVSSDNEGVDRVELWVNGVATNLTDNSEPYSFDWNTTLVDNGNHAITVRSYDINGNTTDSEPIVLTVDNTQSNPEPINITSVVFDNGGFTITWNQSTDGDFSSYELEKSTDFAMNSSSVVFTTDSLEQTTYFDTDVDPLIYQYYRVTVIDTFDYETIGEIVSSSLDPVPTSVNVESVEYDTTQMTISWNESPDGDFKQYNLLTSGSESGEKTLVTSITNKATTFYIITQFNPNIENWYWLEVLDTLGQISIGNGMSNQVNTPPVQSVLNQVVFDNGSFVISWSQNNNDDFKSYTLYESESQFMNGQTEIFSTEEVTEVNYTISEMEEKTRYYQIVVSDIYGLNSLSNIQEGVGKNIFDLTFHGDLDDVGNSVQQTTDGGYIISGITSAEGLGRTSGDVWLIKTDDKGIQEWNQTFGGSTYENSNSVQQTMDGGFIILGEKEVYDYFDQHYDMWLIKTDSQGNEEWSRTFGGSSYEYGYSVQQTTDGGYIITGYTSSFGNGQSDVWLIKTDSQGNEEWSRTFGGSSSDTGYSVQQTTDGGYAIMGKTSSFGNGQSDVWLIKTDSQGNEEWSKTFGGIDSDIGRTVEQTTDGGYIITGYTYSFGNGQSDVWLIKTDNQGNEEWNRTFGGSNYEYGYSAQQTIDNGYIIFCARRLIKTDSQGNQEWIKYYPAFAYSGHDGQQTNDGYYVVTGGRSSNPTTDVFLWKTD